MIRQSRKNFDFKFIVKTVFFSCFILLAAIQTAHAAEATSGTPTSSNSDLTSGTKECEIDDKNSKKIAEQANKELIIMKSKYDEYENLLNAMRNTKDTQICFTPSLLDFQLGDKQSLSGKVWQAFKGFIKTNIDVAKIIYKSITTSDLSFNANDAAGAVIGAKYVPALQNNFDILDKKLKDTSIDIKSHIQDVNSAKHGYESNLQERIIETRKAQESQDKEKIADAKAHYEALKAKIDILNDCQKAFNKVMNPRRAFSTSRNNAHQYLTTLSGNVESQCTCNASTGELLSCEVKDDTFQEDDINDSNCKQLNEYEADFTFCPICGIFETILKADQKLSGGAFDALSSALIKLVLLGFSIFIGYQVLMLIGSPAKQTIGKFLNTILLQGFKVALAVGLLEMPNTVYELGLTPLIESGFEFGLSLIPSDSQGVIEEFAGKYNSFDQGNNLLTADFLQKVMGAVEGYNAKTATFPAIGRSLYCNSWENRIWNVIPHWQMMIEGILIFAFGLMIMLAVGFYLLDIAIHLGVIACLIPFLIACWPFKQTSGYTKTGWNMILNVCFRFIMMGVLLASVIELIKAALEAGIDKGQLETWLNSNDTDALEAAMSINSLQMLVLLVCCMISMKLVSQLSSVTNRFASGGVPTKDMGSKLGGAAASAATAVAKPAALKGGKAIASAGGAMAEAAGVKGAMQAAGNEIVGGIKNIAGQVGIGSKAKTADGRNNGGNPTPPGGGGNSSGGGNSGGGNPTPPDGGSGSGNSGGSNG